MQTKVTRGGVLFFKKTSSSHWKASTTNGLHGVKMSSYDVSDLRLLGLLFPFWTDFTNMAVMLFDKLRNLSCKRRAYCTLVSDQGPFGL